MLLLKRDDPVSVAKGLDAIARNANAQARLIEDLLDMNRIVSGKVRLDLQPTDVAAVVEAAVESVRPQAEGKGLALRVALAPLEAPLALDPHRIQQVVWNLLANAVKFTPRGGAIDVALARVEQHVEISVRDTGLGIDAQFLPQVFDRFRQADASTTRSHGGLGLGLSIARQLVELHGGTLHATSDGPGRGATFVARLPIGALGRAAERSAGAARTKSVAAAAVDLGGLRIVVIDDEADARQLVQQLLADRGAEVHAAASAGEGLVLVAALRPDLVLSDIGMPELDGYDLIERLRELDAVRGGATPAIALTAFARDEDRERTLAAGYQLHLAKPVEPQELLAAVARLAGRDPAR